MLSVYSSDNRMLLFTVATDFPQNVLEDYFNLGHMNVKVKIYSSYYCVKWDILRPGCIWIVTRISATFPSKHQQKTKAESNDNSTADENC